MTVECLGELFEKNGVMIVVCTWVGRRPARPTPPILQSPLTALTTTLIRRGV